jgi:hypothetical protein
MDKKIICGGKFIKSKSNLKARAYISTLASEFYEIREFVGPLQLTGFPVRNEGA